jgi:hypothetical protein
MRIVLTRRETLESPDGVNIFMIALAQALIDLNHHVQLVVGSLESSADRCLESKTFKRACVRRSVATGKTNN